MHATWNRGWTWLALYGVTGVFCPLFALLYWADAGIANSYLGSSIFASFAGAAFVSRFAQGMSLREGVIAAIAAAVLVCLVALALRDGPLPHQAGPSYMLSTLLLSAVGALAGGRLGAVWGRISAYESTQISGALLSTFVFLGAFAVHVAVVMLMAEVAHKVAVFFALVTILVTPALAGAALQLGQREAVEQQMGTGIGLIVAVMIGFVGFRLRDIGSTALVSVAFFGLGATVYSIALPGVMSVRSSRFWRHRWSDVPTAVVVQNFE